MFNVFSICRGLTTVTSLIKEPFVLNGNVFSNDTYNIAPLLVPLGTIDVYKATDGWKNFKNIEEIKTSGSTLTITIVDVNGTNLTDSVSITWYNVEGKEIGTGKSLNGIEDGTELYYSVLLNEELGRVYREVTMRKVVVKDGEPLTCQLEKIGELALHGTVESEGVAIAGADVSLTQWLNGKYEYTANAKTDEKGDFLLKAYSDSTLLTFSAEGYVDRKIERSRLYSADLGTIELEPVQGMVVALQLSYQEAVREGEEPMVQNWYSDTRNIEYSVRNETKGINITDFAMQMGDIVLPMGSEPGDSIVVTVRSLNGKFATADGGGTIDTDGMAKIVIQLVAYGGVEAMISQKGDDQLLVMLYDSNGQLATSTITSASRVTFTGVEAGSYTLVAMGYNGSVGSIGVLSDLDSFGLVEGSDYVIAPVTVRDGIIGNVTIAEVPEFDASKFEYTSLNTSYLPNKNEMILGSSFVTLAARVDFKTQYANEVSDVKLVVDIPDGCEFISNSVVTGTKALPHTLNGNQLTITLGQEDIDSRIRFCMMPKQTGTFISTAYADFDCRGEKRQSIGSAVFEATAGSISVPSTTFNKTIAVNGIAAPHATVDVYDDDQLIGTTTALGDGKWRTHVELYKPYNLSTHKIYAKYQTDDGIKATTETQECFYDMSQVRAKSVTMSFYNAWMRKNISVVFDFETGKTSSNNYSFFTATNFTFVADLTVNDTIRVNGVNFYVHTTSKDVRTLKGFFDEGLGRWVAVSRFESNNLPINLNVEVDAQRLIIADRQEQDDKLSDNKNDFDAVLTQLNELEKAFEIEEEMETNIYQQMLDLLSDENYSENELSALFEELEKTHTFHETTDTISNEEEEHEIMMEKVNEFLKNNNKESILRLFNVNTAIKDMQWPTAPFHSTVKTEEGILDILIEQLTAINEYDLIVEGYDIVETTDSSKIYCLYSDRETSVIDGKTLLKYSKVIKDSSLPETLASRAENREFDEINAIVDVAKNIDSMVKKLSNINETTMDVLMIRIGIVKTIQILVNNLYQSCLKWFDNNIVNTFNNLIQGIDDIISYLEVAMNKHDDLLSAWYKLHESSPYNKKVLEYMINELCYSTDIERVLKKLRLLRKAFVETYKVVQSYCKKLPKLPTVELDALKIGGKLIGGLGVFIELCSFYGDLSQYLEDLTAWYYLLVAIDCKLPCPDYQDQALALQNNIQKDAEGMMRKWNSILESEAGAIVIDALSLMDFANIYVDVAAWFASGALNIYAEYSKPFSIDTKWRTLEVNYWLKVGDLPCKNAKQPSAFYEKLKAIEEDLSNIYNDIVFFFTPVTPIHDPSGYVYEAVPTNRVEGVTATIYFDQDEPTPWDAADFSQVNPQITDETGLYQWDVPQGMWQVRFEKSGYETTQTSWLPVPPPQLEINIPMSEAVAPTVVKARGMESGITLDFSKYMKPATLEKSGRVSATVNGKETSGDVEMLNLEEDPYNKKEFASKVKFVPSTAFKTTDEVVITVKKEVESYADKQMDADFVAMVKIEPEIKGFACDSLIAVDYQGEGVLEIAVLPAAAAKGRTVSISSISTMIATTDKQSVTLDDEGKATITVIGNLPGGSSLHLQLDGTDIEKYVEVNVVLQEKVVKKPKASKRSGSTIESGYLLWLTCNTPGATIYYTLDGSCPCDSTTRKKYTGPFALPAGEVTVSAIAVRQGMEDSDVATFIYTVEGNEQGIAETKVDLHVDAEYADGVLTITGADGCTVRVFDLLGRELASRVAGRHQGTQLSSNSQPLRVQVPKAESYIISITTRDGQTVVRKVTGR